MLFTIVRFMYDYLTIHSSRIRWRDPNAMGRIKYEWHESFIKVNGYIFRGSNSTNNDSNHFPVRINKGYKRVR